MKANYEIAKTIRVRVRNGRLVSLLRLSRFGKPDMRLKISLHVTFANIMSEDSLTINHYLNKFLEKPDHEKLPVNVSVKFLNTLRANIVNKYDKQERVNSVVVLGKLVGALSKTSEILSIFEEQLFKELIKIGIQKPTELTGNSVFKIFNFYLLDNEETLVSRLYDSIHNNLKLIEVLVLRLKSNDKDTIYLTFEFLSYLMYSSSEYSDKFQVILDNIRYYNLMEICEELMKDQVISVEDQKLLMTKYNLGLKNLLNKFSNSTMDLDNPSHKKLIDQVLAILKTYGFSSNASDEEIFKKAGFTKDPANYIVRNYPLSIINNIKIFFNNANQEFKRNYYEQLLLTSSNFCFPIGKIAFEVSLFLTDEVFNAKFPYENLQRFLPYYDSIFYNSMIVCLEFWEKSLSEINDNQDVVIIINLLRSTFKYLNSHITPETSGASFKQMILEMTYSRARAEQLNQINQQRQDIYGGDIDTFDNRLELEVANFVKEERILQLIRGSWFYASDPKALEKFQYTNQANNNGTAQHIPTTRHVRTTKYYTCLSPNRQYVMFKEFANKTDSFPVLDRSNSKSIQLSSIKDVRVTSVGPAGYDRSNPQLRHVNLFINIESRNVFQKVSFIDKSNAEVISFYTESYELALIWSDGIELLLNRPITKVSEFTKSQIEKLFNVRRAAQFSNLQLHNLGEDQGNRTKSKALNDLQEEDEEELYDYNKLIQASEGYYYD